MRLQAALPALAQLCSVVAFPAEQKTLQVVTSKSLLNVRAELKKAEIIPTVINDFLPFFELSVSWPKEKAKLGNTIKTKRVQKQPVVTLHDETKSDGYTTSNMTYVVTLTDPDAPSRDDPKWSEMCHWIAANVTLSQKTYSILPIPFLSIEKDKTLSTKKLDEIIEWKPPGPPEKTGKHRYVFLVFAPRNGTTAPLNLSKPGERKHWGTGKERKGVRDWAKENGLVPVAANFIYAQNEKQ
ncbi:phosphatidylethanolamine-binding protein [Dendryphion nanum]|uniref:Phosphatidylethanolamine-binding protein n=1 Tax=Dendryphion nanum TaxID=256645 RepID=A0A9P9DNR8_9PLEO|nr:phosphatidylethanolamine-binding protein [Dendryphion nanum]